MVSQLRVKCSLLFLIAVKASALVSFTPRLGGSTRRKVISSALTNSGS